MGIISEDIYFKGILYHMKDDYWKDYTDRSEKIFKDSQYVNFYPYIGPKYGDSKLKILVLGESHYAHEEAYEREKKLTELNLRKNGLITSRTIDDVVGSFIWSDWKFKCNSAMQRPYPYTDDEDSFNLGDMKLKPGFTKNYQRTVNLIRGVQSRNRFSNYIWDKLSFYNYFQGIVGTKNHRDHSKITKELIDQSKKALEEVLDKLTPNVVIVWGKTVSNWDKWKLKEVEENRKYDKIKFFHVCHPSTSQWENEFPNTTDRWNKEMFQYKNALKEITAEHPTKMDIRSIFVDLKEKKLGTIQYIGQCNIIEELYLEKNASSHLITGKSNLLLELIFDESKNAKLQFFTADHSAQRAKAILKIANKDNGSSDSDGHFTLAQYRNPSEAQDGLENQIRVMKEIREHFWKISINSIDELYDYIKNFYNSQTFIFDKEESKITCTLYLKKARVNFVDSNSTMHFEITLDKEKNVHFNFFTKDKSVESAKTILSHFDFFSIKKKILDYKENINKINDVMPAKRLSIYAALDAITFMQTMDDMRKKYFIRK